MNLFNIAGVQIHRYNGNNNEIHLKIYINQG